MLCFGLPWVTEFQTELTRLASRTDQLIEIGVDCGDTPERILAFVIPGLTWVDV